MWSSRLSKYSYKFKDGYLLIIDEGIGTTVSVTNNMEQVLTEIMQKEPLKNILEYEIIYRDSFLEWDRVEIQVIGNKQVVKDVSFHKLKEGQKEEDFEYLYVT